MQKKLLERYVAAIMEAERFIKAADAAVERLAGDGSGTLYVTGCKETAAAKRASLDLTRALAELRKPLI